MSAQAHYSKIGLFIISAVAIAVVGLIVLGGGKLFERRILVETYFKESVQGLEVGSPVKIRGVPVGRVEDIDLLQAYYMSAMMAMTPDERTLYRGGVRVTMSIIPGETAWQMVDSRDDEVLERLRKAIDFGLRFKLTSQGITGVLYVEGDFYDPKLHPAMEVHWTPDHPYVPSAPSTVAVIGNVLQDIADKLEHVEFQKLSEHVGTLVTSVTDLVKDVRQENLPLQAKQAMQEFQGTMHEARQIVNGPEVATIIRNAAVASGDVKRITADLSVTAKQVKAATEQLPETIAQMNRSLKRIDSLVAAKGDDVEEAVEHLRATSEELRQLAKNVERYPSQVFFGDPPPRTPPGRR